MADVAGITTTDGSTTKSLSSLSRLTENLDNFLTILTTQLQHQDPLSPMDTHEFTNQLVMFTGVEQQVQMNGNLESLISLQQNNVALGAVTYVGKEIQASGRDFMLQDGKAALSYYLPENAAAAIIQIYDSSGKLIREETAEIRTGLHDFLWDGKDGVGNAKTDGEYSFKVTAANANDQPIAVNHGFKGVVTAVEFDNGNAVLGIGTVLVPLSNVTAVRDVEQAEES